MASPNHFPPRNPEAIRQLLEAEPSCHAVHEFPFDYEPPRDRPAASGDAEKARPLTVLSHQFPESLTKSLQSISEAHAMPTAHVATAMFALCIAKHCKAVTGCPKDIILGCQVPTASGSALTIPFPLRAQFQDEMSAADALQLVSEQLRQGVQTATMVAENALAMKEPLFSEILVVPLDTCELYEKPELLQMLAGNTRLALLTNGVSCGWAYDAQVWHELSLPRFHERLVTLMHNATPALLTSACAVPASSLVELSMLGQNEVDELNKFTCGAPRVPAAADPANRMPAIGVHAQFEQQARLVPRNVAVVGEGADGKQLTYAQLSRSSSLFAARLREHWGVKRGDRVAVLLPRTDVDLFTALLGVLKTGAAYVPVDPTYPEARIEYVLSDSGSSFVVCSIDTAQAVPKAYAGARVVITEMRGEIYADAEVNEPCLPNVSELGDTMVILYTSGTTGKPKGVVLTHENAMFFMENKFWDPITEHDIWAQMSNPCFIGSMNDIWIPLVRGACVSQMPKSGMLDAQQFRRSLRQRGITCLFLTPKLLELYADVDPTVFEGLNVLQFAGEAVRADAVAKLAGRVPHLQHLYGCTERMGCISGFEMPAEGLSESLLRVPRIPIGLPIENTQTYVLDESRQPVPVGVLGELYVGGRQVTKGYLNRLEATQEKFLANPFHGGRMYRTGDLVRWLPDGSGLDLVGRIDSMVKIRGFRVELGEIEAEIMAGPEGCKGAVVTTVEPQPGNLVLVAYVTPAQCVGHIPALRARLSAALPAYMVPVYICAVEAIPLNAYGKVDRRALPEPRELQRQQQPLYRSEGGGAPAEAPEAMTAMEVFVAEVFEALLSVPASAIAADTSFADIGGHSLLAMRLLSKLRERCPALQFSDLMHAGTPRLIARRIAEVSESGASAYPEEILKLNRHGLEDPHVRPVFVVHGGSGLVDYFAPIGDRMKARPLFGLRLTAGGLARARQHPSGDFFTGLCAHYADCIRAVQPKGPYTLSGNSLGAIIALGMAVELERAGETVSRLVPIDMPPVKFDKYIAYATASNRHEKAPVLLALTMGRAFNKLPEEEFQRELALLEANMDREILGSHGTENPKAVSAAMDDQAKAAVDEKFVKMNSTMQFMLRVGAPADAVDSIIRGVAVCGGLFVDSVQRGLMTRAAVDLVMVSDNRLMVHTLQSNGMEALIPDYGWHLTTEGTVRVIPAHGDHVTVTDDELGMTELAQCFDDPL